SPMVNKTVEGYPGGRYYGGAEHADVVERLAIERTKQLFGASYANVQPHSGSQANLAVFLAFLKPGDTILSMDLSAGGHLSHGAGPNISGKWMNAVHYGVTADGWLNYHDLEAKAATHRPKLIIAGGSAYPRAIDFTKFRFVADEVGAILLVDMAHWAGLVAVGAHPDPLPHADVVTATTYKNLRGVRGGLILSARDDLDRKLDSAVFPGVQGSVILNAVAAKAVCLGEALRPEFTDYAEAVLANARTLAATLVGREVDVMTGGTDTPLLLIDLRQIGLTGAEASDALEAAGLTANKNGVPGDPQPPQVTSGLRFGTSAGTARGFGEAEFAAIGHGIADVLESMVASTRGEVAARTRSRVTEMCERFPIYPSG
ncbi:MAG TPA: serine hydroxymethyltransferase, partial [Actinobacteria bacterium]|nr:serine hydroxymethyltransferase [Actinomycetota bacterium]